MEQRPPKLSREQVKKIADRIKLGEKPSPQDPDEAAARQRQAAIDAKRQVEEAIDDQLKDKGIGPKDGEITVGGQTVDTSQVPGTPANRERNK